MARSHPSAIGFAVVAACALAAAAPSDGGGFAGSKECQRCHLVRGWAESWHHRSTAEARAGNLPAEALHSPGRTVFAREGDRASAEVVGDDGKPHRFPVELAVGGRRMSMFVTRLPDGRRQILPGMREDPGGPWFDYTHLLYGGPETDPRLPPVVHPGEVSFWTGPDRSFDARCTRCHMSGYVGGSAPSPWRAPGVDCEACHGEGAPHAAHWSSPPAKPARDPLPDLRKLDRDASLAVCLACHMEGETVQGGFRPGEDLFERVDPTLLDAVLRVEPDGRPRQLIYEGLSFLASTCAGAGGLTCLSCHEAHGGPNRSQLKVPPERSNSLCAGCHGTLTAEPGRHSRHGDTGSGGLCVSCHMPLLTIERGHGAVHDHTLAIPRPAPAGEDASRDACSWCHAGARGAPADAPRLAPESLRSSYTAWWPRAAPPPAWALALASAREEKPGAGEALESVLRDHRNPRVVRASAARLLRGLPGDAEAWALSLTADPDSLVRRGAAAALEGWRSEDADRALLRALSDDSLAVRGAAARAALGGWERVRSNAPLLAAVIPVLEEEARAVPDDHLRWFRLGAARQLAGDAAGAVEAYERKLALDPAARYVREQVAKLRRQIEEGRK